MPRRFPFPADASKHTDADIASAALREAQEEIGLDPARVQVFGYLPDHLVISGFRVTPVLGLVTPPFALELNPAEVAGSVRSAAGARARQRQSQGAPAPRR